MNGCVAPPQTALTSTDIQHPVCAALIVNGSGSPLPVSSGLSDDVFDHDGQITKRPIRAITLSTLAPRPGSIFGTSAPDQGPSASSGCSGHPANRTTAIEHNSERAARIRYNANTLGADRLQLFEGTALEFLRRQTCQRTARRSLYRRRSVRGVITIACGSTCPSWNPSGGQFSHIGNRYAAVEMARQDRWH